MSVIGAARDQIAALVGNVVERLGDGSAHAASRQTVTVACSVVEALDFWRDPHRLSVILGEAGEVQFSAPDRYRWLVRAGEHEATWESTLHSAPGMLRFADDAGHEVVVACRAAPHHLGTEMSLRTALPAPGLPSGAGVFALLYRARALIQTGEVPTIAHNPSGR